MIALLNSVIADSKKAENDAATKVQAGVRGKKAKQKVAKIKQDKVEAAALVGELSRW